MRRRLKNFLEIRILLIKEVLRQVLICKTLRSRKLQLNIPLDAVRSFWSLQLSLGLSENPFCQYLHWRIEKQETPNPLAKFYELCRPETAADFLGLNTLHPPQIARLPPLAVNVPWRGDISAKVAEDRLEVIARENEKVDAKRQDAWGWQICGPVSASKLQLEQQRLDRIHESFSLKGYRDELSTSAPLAVDVLVSHSGVSYFISDGQHRLAVMAVLGYKSAKFQVRAVISPKRVHRWPAVESGALTESEAIDIFRAIASGAQPKCCEKWLDYCRNLEKSQFG
jgi:hypothetical protein